VDDIYWWRAFILAWAVFVAVAVNAFSKVFKITTADKDKFLKGLQDTINHLRARQDQQEADIRQCLEDRAALRKELEMLKKCQ
jgi:hypothetical protein